MSDRKRLLRALPVLAAILLLQVVWRAHTFGGASALSRPFVKAGLAAGGTIEPLDCDESIYAYMGRRMTHGDVLYRDLSENKPPLGYWIYGLAVAVGGANEWSIRLLPMPFVLATTVLVWLVARRLGGEVAGLAAAFVFALVDTDPYLFGNGANLEHEMSFFAVASLACFLKGWPEGKVRWLVAAGLMLGAECLIKQTAVVPMIVFVPALLLPIGESMALRRRVGSLAAFLAGFGAIWLVCLGILAIQGNLREGFDHFVTWAMALSRETPPDPGAPPGWSRWLTGNADPRGRLPWPFGKTDYLVWWGTGAWPLWLLFAPSALAMIVARRSNARARFVGLWTFATFVEVVLSGLYWQHYYLLPVPGLAICAAVACLGGVAVKRAIRVAAALALAAATTGTIVIQTRDYWLRTPEEITSKYKGGAQWVALRKLAIDLKTRVAAAGEPATMYVWGWQSPLYLYGEFDAPTPYAFADPLLKAKAGEDHPLIRPRVDRIVADLKAKPPILILAADPPFPALLAFLRERYVQSWSSGIPNSPDGRGMWVLQSAYARFERAGARPSPGP